MNIFLKCTISLVLVVSLSATADEWYQGGNLHNAGILDWQEASYKNKLATASDSLIELYQKDYLNHTLSLQIKGLTDINNIKQYATELYDCIDGASSKEADHELNQKLYANQTVAGFAALCVTMMGWGR